MSLNIENQELIDAYLSNKMGASSKLSFEQQLSNNSQLNEEVQLQKQLVESLKAARKAELKARLNAIQVGSVGSTTSTFSVLKIAASIFIGAGIIGALYYTFIQPTKENTQATIINTIVPETTKPTTTIAKISTEESEVNTTTPVAITNEVSVAKTTTTNKATNRIKLKSNASISVPEENLATNETDFQSNANFKQPTGDVVQNNEISSSDVEVSVENTSDNKFYYKYYNNKLFLVCNFNSKPYELLELNVKKNKELYLYFDGKYYELKSNKLEATPLEVLRKTKVIEQLNTIRGNK